MRIMLDFKDTRDFLEKYALPIPKEDHAETQEEVVESPKSTGFRAKVKEDSKRGMEAIIGMTRDGELGPIVTFGLSGVFAFIKDVSSKVAPISKEEAIDMIKETKAYDILKGDGEKKASDTNAIADVMEKVSRLAIENNEIKEIEINPLHVYEEGVLVIEARIMVG